MAGGAADRGDGLSDQYRDRGSREPGEVFGGAEADGAQYRSAVTTCDRDRLRHRILGQKGWSLLRVWSPDWWRDPGGVTGPARREAKAAGAMRTA